MQTRILPTHKYCGITFILSNPSRFDVAAGTLFTGYVRYLINDCLRPNFGLENCEVRLTNEIGTPLLAGTKVIIALGDKAMILSAGVDYASYTLKQLRGYVLRNPQMFGAIPIIPTFIPQDCLDIVNWEAIKNPELLADEAIDDDDGDEEDSGKEYSSTRRATYRFWFEMDLKKASKFILEPQNTQDKLDASYIYDPDLNDLLTVVKFYKNRAVVLDIETSMLYPGGLLCLSLGFYVDNTILTYAITVTDYMLEPALTTKEQWLLLKILQYVFDNNEIIVHNAMFDLFILSAGYGLRPPTCVFDTMLTHARLYPGTEKSLGHCISLYTWQHYHKDEGLFSPKNSHQQRRLLEYNAKDVYTTALIAHNQHAQENESIVQVNESVEPYLTSSIKGIRVDVSKMHAMSLVNERKLTQLKRICAILVDNPKFNPNSSKQCAEYFHTIMQYKVVKRSDKTKEASIDVNVLFAIKLNNPDNQCIDFILKYRTIAKENSNLKFKLWNTDTLWKKQLK